MEYYNGIFIRDYKTDQGQVPTKKVSPTSSPDIITYQSNALTVDEAVRTYDTPINLPVNQGMPNNIYVRAKNKGTSGLTGKVRVYCAPLNVLYKPADWKQLITFDGETEVDFVNRKGSTAIANDEIALVKKPFYLTEVVNPRMHHCLFALATDPEGKWLDLPVDFRNNTILWDFLREHKQFANRNITIARPFEHTETQIVEFGNYDEVPRKFNLVIHFLNGVETVEGATLLTQCTDAACCFSKEQKIQGGKESYDCEFTIPPRFFGTMNISCIMNYPKQAECLYSVRNYLIEEKGRDNIQYQAKLRHCLTQQEDPAERLGDYAMILTQQEINGRHTLSDVPHASLASEDIENEVYEFQN